MRKMISAALAAAIVILSAISFPAAAFAMDTSYIDKEEVSRKAAWQSNSSAVSGSFEQPEIYGYYKYIYDKSHGCFYLTLNYQTTASGTGSSKVAFKIDNSLNSYHFTVNASGEMDEYADTVSDSIAVAGGANISKYASYIIGEVYIGVEFLKSEDKKVDGTLTFSLYVNDKHYTVLADSITLKNVEETTAKATTEKNAATTAASGASSSKTTTAKSAAGTAQGTTKYTAPATTAKAGGASSGSGTGSVSQYSAPAQSGSAGSSAGQITQYDAGTADSGSDGTQQDTAQADSGEVLQAADGGYYTVTEVNSTLSASARIMLVIAAAVILAGLALIALAFVMRRRAAKRPGAGTETAGAQGAGPGGEAGCAPGEAEGGNPS